MVSAVMVVAFVSINRSNAVLSDSSRQVEEGSRKVWNDSALIEESMHDVTTISTNVVNGMQEIATGIQQNQESAQQVREESEQLGQSIDQINAAVRRFVT